MNTFWSPSGTPAKPPDVKPADKTAVRTAHESDRGYALLAELNIKPRTAYLARIRNPNPELEPEEPSGEDDAHH